jgi:hypothetical protein
MPTHEENLARVRRTPDEIAALIEGRTDAELSRRPAERAWAATEVVCHLRDTEEFFATRLLLALYNEEPRWLPAVDPDRWAAERQYLRNHASDALAAFRARRADSIALLASLTPEQWERAGVHPSRGRLTLRDLLAVNAAHDDNHLAQLSRALRGEP